MRSPPKNRKLKFAGVRKANFVGYNSTKQRIHYLCIGTPPQGRSGGNTAANTHRVLQIVQKAMRETGNHGDGGWGAALTVLLLFYMFLKHVIAFLAYTHAFIHVM